MVNTILSISGTVLLYALIKRLYIKANRPLYLMPLLVCPLLIGTFLVTVGIPYNDYKTGGNIISWILQPATIAFAVPLYKYRKTIKEYAVPMSFAIIIAAIVAVLTSIGLAFGMGLGNDLAMSLAPRSITTPLALAATDIIGGDPTITAVLVIATGIIGMILANIFITRLGIRNNLLKGLLFGITAHGTGTAKAYEHGPKTGAIASLAMIFMGIFTTLLAPIIAHLDKALK